MRLDMRVNGEQREADGVWEGESLLYVLRERLGLPGSKNACEQGECGSCSVYLDGVTCCSCLVAAGCPYLDPLDRRRSPVLRSGGAAKFGAGVLSRFVEPSRLIECSPRRSGSFPLSRDPDGRCREPSAGRCRGLASERGACRRVSPWPGSKEA